MSHARFLTLLAACACLCACASTGGRKDATGAVADAATAPLADLNLLRKKIPGALLAARAAPYAPPVTVACESLATEVSALDDALGPDLDAPAAGSPGWREQGEAAAGDAALDALRNTTEGVLPFRGWVRKLSGAERHSREVAAAVAAGTVRRAFLKGLGQAGGCPPGVAPRRPGPAAPAPVAPAPAAPAPATPAPTATAPGTAP